MRVKVMLGILIILLQLVGCGSGTSGSNSPFSAGQDNSTPVPPTTSTPTTENGAVLSYNLVLSVTPTSGTGTTVGSNSTVIATATLKDSSGNPIANQPIKFEAIEGPVTINQSIVTTDSSGKAINFLKAGVINTSATDVILKASTSVKTEFVTAIGIFKIMRSETNIIKFMTTKEPTDPDGTLNTIKAVLKEVPPLPPQQRQILQLVPFQILDNNGIPRNRVPVKVSVYSKIGDCPVFIDSPEATEMTVTTDDAGLGIFNAGVTLDVPAIGSEDACSVIYKAEAVDPNNAAITLYSYGGFIAVLANEWLAQ